MLLSCFSDDQKLEALKAQLDDLEKPVEEDGADQRYTFVNFLTGQIETRIEAHYDFAPIIDAVVYLCEKF